eukprot:16877-Heterococcus_DN1.PRE.3
MPYCVFTEVVPMTRLYVQYAIKYSVIPVVLAAVHALVDSHLFLALYWPPPLQRPATVAAVAVYMKQARAQKSVSLSIQMRYSSVEELHSAYSLRAAATIRLPLVRAAVRLVALVVHLVQWLSSARVSSTDTISISILAC